MFVKGVDILFLHETAGCANFRGAHRRGDRIGQAWMNSAPQYVYEWFTGSLYDPFYYDGHAATKRIIEGLEAMTAP